LKIRKDNLVEDYKSGQDWSKIIHLKGNEYIPVYNFQLIICIQSMAKKKSTVPSGKVAQSISSANKARMIEHCLLNISTNMEVLKAKNNGKLPYGAISCAVHNVQELVPWATTQKVKYFLRKMRLSGSTSSYQHGQTAGGGCA
jgi:hypothetical protein